MNSKRSVEFPQGEFTRPRISKTGPHKIYDFVG